MIRYISICKFVFICLRHHINPFGKGIDNLKKVRERFTEKEKNLFISICKNEYVREYLRNILKIS